MKNPKATKFTQAMDMKGWKEGPLPPNTWNWGGVVEKGEHPHNGFFFADFQGDHALIVVTSSDDSPTYPMELKADEVGWYNNCLELPGW